MKFTFIIALFIVFSFHYVESDPIFKYQRLNVQYNDALPLNLFVEILVECHKQKANANKMVAISYRESHFKNVIGHTGNDIGFFQINRAHVGKNERFEDYYDMHKNVAKGISIYLSAERKAKGNERLTLAYYNAGENSSLKNYTFKQWRDYVDFIIALSRMSDRADREKIVIK